MQIDEQIRACVHDLESSLLVLVPASAAGSHDGEHAAFYAAEVPLAVQDARKAISNLLRLAEALSEASSTTSKSA